MKRLWSLTALAAALLAGGCSDLEVQNPNAPDAKRAFVDPSGLTQLLGGAVRTWVETRGGYFSSLVLTAMADNYTASWNNAALRYYSSVGSECPSRCGWNNSATAPEAAGGPNVEGPWYGYYTVLSSATDIIRAIDGGLCFDTNCTVDNTKTTLNKTIAKMLQGMALAGIALNYDQGFIVDETTDLSNVAGLPFSPRLEVRDAAIKKFDEAYTEAGLKTWTTPPEFHGVGAGRTYTNTQIRQLIRTMQAELLALYPRNSAENAQVAWAQVATYASQGVSSGSAFNWEYYVDPSRNANSDDPPGPLDYEKTWGNSIGTMRVDTRVAAMITTNHKDPWPEAQGGNPCPTISADKRVGDGSWGPADDFNGYATKAATANAGTDFACSGVAIFSAARGQYHQSNLAHIRYNYLAYTSEALPGSTSNGQDPLYTIQMNDLLWAEGLIRGGGNKLLGAQKINNSRVGRGGLSTLTGLESDAALLSALQYEQEIEFMGQGGTPFYNRRRIDGLQLGTPRQMPVPAKELDVLVREIYTFGGPNRPDMSIGYGGVGSVGTSVRSVREIWNQYQAQARQAAARKY
jgi:hypothetical protein